MADTYKTSSGVGAGNAKLVGIAMAFVVVAGLSFLGGMQLQKSLNKNTAAASGNPTNARQGMGFGGAQGSRQRPGAFGTVKSTTSDSMVVSSRNGSDVTVSLTGSPTVTDSSGAASSVGAIQTGDTVMVMGTTNSDGSVTAKTIRINPSFSGQSQQQGANSGT